MDVKKKSFITVILFVSLSAQAQVMDHIRQFASALDSLRIALKIPAMSAALKLGDSIVFEEGFGYADITHHQKATVNTCYRIASITKTFTSTLVMQLVEKGK